MKIGFVGGGTGGHFYPLVAVAEVLQQDAAAPELYYFGPAPYDAKALDGADITYIYCPAGKLRRYFSPMNIVDFFRSLAGVIVSIGKLFAIYPDVIFSKGGFTSVPILVAARVLRIPVVIHESDAVPGRANLLGKNFARYIGITYDDTGQHFPPERTALVGIPMRSEILTHPADPFAYLEIPQDKPLIYVTGGSSGAERLNNIILRTLAELLPHYRIYHQTGSANVDEQRLTAQSLLEGTGLEDSYYIVGKIPAETVAALYSAASLIITRAGSTTLFEIAAYGKPAVVIPIPEDVSRDQRTNAYTYARGGAAAVIEEANLTQHLLIQEINSIIGDADRYRVMSQAAKEQYMPDAAHKVADILLSIGHEHGS